MSKGARIAIGIVALIGAFGFWLTAQDTEGLPSGPLMFYGLTAFFILIAIACFVPKSHPVTLRVIGSSIFVSYVWYVFDSIQNGNLRQALLGLVIWGVPSGYLAIFGTYPTSGSGAKAFNQAQRLPRKK